MFCYVIMVICFKDAIITVHTGGRAPGLKFSNSPIQSFLMQEHGSQ